MTGDRFRKIAISTAKNKVQFRDKARYTRRKIRLDRKTIRHKENAQENGANDILSWDVLQKKLDNRLEWGAALSRLLGGGRGKIRAKSRVERNGPTGRCGTCPQS